jgi:pimeloyl-ACP methyl ester carboxylesterase
MHGVLFKYGPSAANVAFKSHPQHSRHLVLIGGLTDGLLFAPYCHQLSEAAGAAGWSLVQAQLTTSYQGYGVGSLDADAEELHQLAACLGRDHGSRGWVLMGHSTGCQDGCRYAARHGRAGDQANNPNPLLGLIMQGPVSGDVWWLAAAAPRDT